MAKTRKQLPYPQAVQPSIFVARKNRFLVECRSGGRIVRAHLPNPGRLRELLLPGRTVLLTGAERQEGRKTAWTVVGVMRDGEAVMLHTHYSNRAAAWLLEQKLVPGLEEYGIVRSEVPLGGSRFDFLLGRREEELYVEVKSCTLFEGGTAMFPDAVTARGRRHVLELAEMGRGGTGTCVLFMVQSSKARMFLPDYHTDPAFAAALHQSRNDLLIRAVGVSWDKNLTLAGRVRNLPVPWGLYEKEACGGGSCLVVLRLNRKRRIRVGRQEPRAFPAGYYIYVDSGGRSLFARIRRHRRGGTSRHRPIDYLRAKAEWREGLAVQTADSIECTLARDLRRIADGQVDGFGSSDCRCGSHLLYMKGDPMQKEAFIDMIAHYRMGRLGKAVVEPGHTG